VFASLRIFQRRDAFCIPNHGVCARSQQEAHDLGMYVWMAKPITAQADAPW
jgi:hypothetical protein